jgi:hypothetical protein
MVLNLWESDNPIVRVFKSGSDLHTIITFFGSGYFGREPTVGVFP